MSQSLEDLFNQAAGATPTPMEPLDTGAPQVFDASSLLASSEAAPAATLEGMAPPATNTSPVQVPTPPTDLSVQMQQMMQQNQLALQEAAYYRGIAEQAAAQRNALLQSTPAPATPATAPVDYSLSAEEQIAYGEHLPVFEKVAARASAHAAAGYAELKALQEATAKQLAEINTKQAEQRMAFADTQFERAVIASVPDLATFKDTPAWRDYLSQIDPERGVPRAQIVEQYSNAHNHAAVVYHFKQAKLLATPVVAQPSKPVVPTPMGRTAGQPIPPTGGLPTISLSAKQIFGDEGLAAKLKAGKITREAYDELLEASFNYAAAGVPLTA